MTQNINISIAVFFTIFVKKLICVVFFVFSALCHSQILGNSLYTILCSLVFFSLRLGQTFMQDFVDTKFAPLMNCLLQLLFKSVSERKKKFSITSPRRIPFKFKQTALAILYFDSLSSKPKNILETFS